MNAFPPSSESCGTSRGRQDAAEEREKQGTDQRGCQAGGGVKTYLAVEWKDERDKGGGGERLSETTQAMLSVICRQLFGSF